MHFVQVLCCGAKSIVDEGCLDFYDASSNWLSGLDGLDCGEARLLGENNLYDISVWYKVMAEVNDVSQYVKINGAFYNKTFYVYFGVVPCLISYVPFYALTGANLPNTFAMLPALVVFAIFSYLLIDLLAKRKFPHASTASVCLAFFACIMASCTVNAAVIPIVYFVPMIYALAFLACGTYVLARAYCAKNARARLVLVATGSFLLALTLGCRPQIAIAAIIAGIAYLVFEVKRFLRVRKVQGQQKIAPIIICCTAPVFLFLAGLMWYNYVRFGSPLDFGADYNLTSSDMTLNSHSISRGIEGALYYLFALPELTSSYPFLNNLTHLPKLNTAIRPVSETFVGGIFFMTPFALLSLVELFNRRQKIIVKCFILTCLLFAFFIAIFDAEAPSITYRYLCDFGFALGFASATAILSISKSTKRACPPAASTAARTIKAPIESGILKNKALHLCTPNTLEMAYVVLIAFSIIAALVVWVGLNSSLVGLKLSAIQRTFDVLGPVIR